MENTIQTTNFNCRFSKLVTLPKSEGNIKFNGERRVMAISLFQRCTKCKPGRKCQECKGEGMSRSIWWDGELYLAQNWFKNYTNPKYTPSTAPDTLVLKIHGSDLYSLRQAHPLITRYNTQITDWLGMSGVLFYSFYRAGTTLRVYPKD